MNILLIYILLTYRKQLNLCNGYWYKRYQIKQEQATGNLRPENLMIQKQMKSITKLNEEIKRMNIVIYTIDIN